MNNTPMLAADVTRRAVQSAIISKYVEDFQLVPLTHFKICLIGGSQLLNSTLQSYKIGIDCNEQCCGAG